MAEETLSPANPPEENKEGKKEEKKSGLFVIKSSKSKDLPQSSAISSQEVSALSGRIRVIEERMYNLRRKTQLTDQNMLAGNKKTSTKIKELNDDMKDLKLDMEDLRTVIQQIINEMKKFAAKNEVETLKKYIDLWQPLDFMRREQVENLIKESMTKLEKK